jgi:hypothetical protein
MQIRRLTVPEEAMSPQHSPASRNPSPPPSSPRHVHFMAGDSKIKGIRPEEAWEEVKRGWFAMRSRTQRTERLAVRRQDAFRLCGAPLLGGICVISKTFLPDLHIFWRCA